MMMPSLLPALFALVALAGDATSISVPTGKETPITPAKVTPRPTYRPPTSNPAPVVEYSLDNPEPEPLDPSWAYVPVKYLNVLSANSIRYVPMTIRNPYPNLQKENVAVIAQVYDYNFGAKVPKEKYKPRYYHPKFAQAYKVPTKGGYPKKATSDMKYYYYQKQDEQQQQLQQEPQQQLQLPQQQQFQEIPQQQYPQAPQQLHQVPQQQYQQAPQQVHQVPQQQYQQTPQLQQVPQQVHQVPQQAHQVPQQQQLQQEIQQQPLDQAQSQ